MTFHFFLYSTMILPTQDSYFWIVFLCRTRSACLRNWLVKMLSSCVCITWSKQSFQWLYFLCFLFLHSCTWEVVHYGKYWALLSSLNVINTGGLMQSSSITFTLGTILFIKALNNASLGFGTFQLSFSSSFYHWF